MKHNYSIEGMTCSSCHVTVKNALSALPGVRSVLITPDPPEAIIEMDRHISIGELQAALKINPRYRISEFSNPVKPVTAPLVEEEKLDFWTTYKPILLVFGFIIGVTVLIEINHGDVDGMRWMRHFMAGFFIVFSFFKLLDLPSFAMSYSTYDVIAKRLPVWGYFYPFVELILGILFLLNIEPLITNITTLLVMSASTIGVVQSLREKRKIKCACLGAVFNLPMSTITLMEDLLMVVMAGFMIIHYA